MTPAQPERPLPDPEPEKTPVQGYPNNEVPVGERTAKGRADYSELGGGLLAVEAARLLDERRGADVVVYDLRGISDVTDYFVVGSGEHRIHIEAMMKDIVGHCRGRGVRPLGVEGEKAGSWILIDYGDCIIHLFEREVRSYYDLDLLWGDAPKVEWKLKEEGAGSRKPEGNDL